MFRRVLPLAFTLAALAGGAKSATITVVSDAGTLGAATTLANAEAGDESGATFVPVLVGSYGTFTGVPSGSPAGTMVINIAPGDGESGFFRDTFTLPSSFAGISIAGAASIDDEAVVYLNGHALNEPSHDVSFSSSDSSLFTSGVNTLDIADLNTGGGPSGGGFYANVAYSAVGSAPEPGVWALMLMGVGFIGGMLRMLGARRREEDAAIAF